MGSATGIGGLMSLALIGGGHLMGIAVGMAMLAGLVLRLGLCRCPLLTHHVTLWRETPPPWP